MLFEMNGFYVSDDTQHGFRVFCPAGTHAESTEAYPNLALAICRVLYLAGERKGIAARAEAEAARISAGLSAHGRKMREAAAAFDAEFMA